MDYIYYRMYVWYKRKKDCAKINSALFIASIRFFLYFPFMGIAINFFNNARKGLTLILYLVYAVSILTHSLIK